ncbi:MAG TPA: outer membrane protein transport protein, partial [Sulfuricurvum sp.]|nr:outer membrane protein transport protein [Sulfuricurvum sp.]
AKGYKDFGWDDQDVIIVGYQYAQDNWAVRAGYNHSKSPIKEQDGTTYNGAVLNFFNLVGFPAIVEDHYTVGGSYNLSKSTSVDLAYVYVPEAKETFNTTAMTSSMASGGMSLTALPSTTTTKHSQDAVSVQVNFNF